MLDCHSQRCGQQLSQTDGEPYYTCTGLLLPSLMTRCLAILLLWELAANPPAFVGETTEQ